MLSIYTNGEVGWDHRSMFSDLLLELRQAKKDKVIKEEAADKLINMVKGWLLKELEGGEPVNWQAKYKKLIGWYNVFEESGYINYENDEQNNNRVETKNNESNNLYFWCKND